MFVASSLGGSCCAPASHLYNIGIRFYFSAAQIVLSLFGENPPATHTHTYSARSLSVNSLKTQRGFKWPTHLDLENRKTQSHTVSHKLSTLSNRFHSSVSRIQTQQTLNNSFTSDTRYRFNTKELLGPCLSCTVLACSYSSLRYKHQISKQYFWPKICSL